MASCAALVSFHVHPTLATPAAPPGVPLARAIDSSACLKKDAVVFLNAAYGIVDAKCGRSLGEPYRCAFVRRRLGSPRRNRGPLSVNPAHSHFGSAPPLIAFNVFESSIAFSASAKTPRSIRGVVGRER